MRLPFSLRRVFHIAFVSLAKDSIELYSQRPLSSYDFATLYSFVATLKKIYAGFYKSQRSFMTPLILKHSLKF
jgi:hypothetical protein